MDDNTLISHELTHVIDKQRSFTNYLAALKLDMNKDYDRVSWLLSSRFSQLMASRHIGLNSSTNVFQRSHIKSQLTAQQHNNCFKPECGLRQGDPLSPYLFLFCMDIHSLMTTMATNINQFKGCPVNKGGKSMSHLFFGDDAVLFFKSIPMPAKLSNK